MFFTPSLGQLYLLLTLGKALFLLFADTVDAMMAREALLIGIQCFFLFRDGHATGMSLVVRAAF